MYFQDVIFKLQQYWCKQGCMLLQPYDLEVGAGTSHPATVLYTLKKNPWNIVYVQPSRRPTDGRYGDNPNRTQMFYQLQVILKPAPFNNQDICLESLKLIGLDPKENDLRFVEDDWENPSLGAAGVGWQIWCNGLEIVQYTYFQQVGGIQLKEIPLEITYGLERITAFIQGVESHFDIKWNKDYTYGDIFKKNEFEFSKYNFEEADVEILKRHFEDAEKEASALLNKNLVLPAYEQCLKANHLFNLLDARGVISVTQRASFILKIRSLAKHCCELYMEQS